MNNDMQKIMKQAMNHAKKQAENESINSMMATIQTMLLIKTINRHVSNAVLDNELETSADEVVKQLITKDSTENEIESMMALVNLVKTHAKGAVRSISDNEPKN